MVTWITSTLATGPYSTVSKLEDVSIVDIRSAVDRGGNMPSILASFVQRAVAELRAGRRVAISCDHGISRSNAIAAGVISQYQSIPFAQAARLVLGATNGAEIRVDVLESVATAIGAEGWGTFADDSEKRWLLTGAAGYLGRALQTSCPQGIDLICPSRSELDLLDGAVNLDLFVREKGISRILHFAAPHVSNTNTALGEAVVMTRNVLDVCEQNTLPVLLPSRWEAFAGYEGEELVVDEMTPLRPKGVLGDTKALIESLADFFRSRSNMKICILRSGLVYGGDNAPNFMRSFLEKASRGDVITTHAYENGAPLLDLVHVNDWTKVCWGVLCAGLEGVCQIGSGSLISTREIADIIIQATDSGSEVTSITVAGEAASVAFSNRRINMELGFTPLVGARSGVDEYARTASLV